MLTKVLGLIVGKEPVAFSALVSALVGLAAAFGWDLTDKQLAAVTAAVVAVSGFGARAVVTPVRKGAGL